MTDEKLVFNGLTPDGDYAFPRLTEEEMARLALEETTGDELLRKIQEEARKKADRKFRRDPPQGVDPADLARTGWGVIFSEDTPRKVRRALHRFIEYRRDQATRKGRRFRRLIYPRGTQTSRFLLNNGATLYETARPSRLPYYLLIVGSPEEIPYEFQYELNLQYAVGRIHFDRSEDYERYGQGVIRAERRPPRSRRVTFFGVENEGDSATAATAQDLVEGLANRIDGYRSGWQVDRFMREEASKSCLSELLGGAQTPALLFAGGHGLVPQSSTHREALQGALVCSDWSALGDIRPAVEKEQMFTAQDLEASSANPEGLVAFIFACYSAGTPDRDDFNLGTATAGRAVGDRPFVSSLSKKLLTRGALAMIGHVDRTWTSSFRWPGGRPQIETFSNVLKRLLDGQPVGSALGRFAERHGQISGWLWSLRDKRSETPPDDFNKQYSRLWRGGRDARNFVVVGDPAVRLRM